MAQTNISFLYNDVFDTATATAYSAISTLPVTNLQTALVDQVYRSLGDTDDEWIKFDCGSAVSINCIVLINHNLSTASNNLIIEAHTSDSWANPDFTTTISAWESGETDSGTKTNTRVCFLSSTTTKRWWRIRPQEGGSNPDNYIQIGRIMGGVYVEASKNFRYGWSQTLVDGSSKKRIGTVTYVDRRYKWNRIECDMQLATDAEKQDTFLVMLNSIGIAEDFVLMLKPSTASGRNDLSFYGQLSESPQFINDFTTYHRARFVFDESIGDNSEIPVLTYARGVFGGGTTGDYSNVIDYITIATTGNAIDFGDLTVARRNLASCASSTRGVFSGGYTGSVSNVIDYITIATAGNATDFGDLTVARMGLASCASSTRGVFNGGYIGSASNVIDYITIATTGNATDFGDLTVARSYSASCASSSRGVFGGGFAGAVSNVIDYITIATIGNATDFGDLTVARTELAACASSTRGVFGGGDTGSVSNVIDYITIATTGNVTDFGDLTVARVNPSSCASSTRGVFGGGDINGSASYSNVIDYITIAILGNATDFGDLTAARGHTAACANKGGL
jgi:hypothetical protein